MKVFPKMYLWVPGCDEVMKSQLSGYRLCLLSASKP